MTVDVEAHLLFANVALTTSPGTGPDWTHKMFELDLQANSAIIHVLHPENVVVAAECVCCQSAATT